MMPVDNENEPRVLSHDEYVAMVFHRTYERLAPQFGYETRPESAVAWDDVPENNRNLMMAVVHELTARGLIR